MYIQYETTRFCIRRLIKIQWFCEWNDKTCKYFNTVRITCFWNNLHHIQTGGKRKEKIGSISTKGYKLHRQHQLSLPMVM